MNLLGKKKKEKKSVCKCRAETIGTTKEYQVKGENSYSGAVKILGSGCAKCNQLETNTRAALKQLGTDIAIEHITNFAQIADYGVMTTPALVYNDKVLSCGKVLKSEEIAVLIEKEVQRCLAKM